MVDSVGLFTVWSRILKMCDSYDDVRLLWKYRHLQLGAFIYIRAIVHDLLFKYKT